MSVNVTSKTSYQGAHSQIFIYLIHICFCMDPDTGGYGGFDLRNPEEIRLTPKRGYTADHLRDVCRKNSLVTKMRGRVIGSCLNIERRLDSFISDVMVNKKKKSLFKELILEKEFFTLMNKWKLFRELIKQLGINNISEDERKELLTLTKEIIETRDRFAHGKVTFSAPLKLHDSPLPKLNFLFGGEKKEIILNDKYFSDYEKKFIKTLELFDKLTNFKYLHKD